MDVLAAHTATGQTVLPFPCLGNSIAILPDGPSGSASLRLSVLPDLLNSIAVLRVDTAKCREGSQLRADVEHAFSVPSISKLAPAFVSQSWCTDCDDETGPLLFVSLNRTLRVYHWQADRSLSQPHHACALPWKVRCVATLRQTGSSVARVAVGGPCGLFHNVYNPDTHNFSSTWAPAAPQVALSCVTFSRCGRFVAAASIAAHVLVWEVSTDQKGSFSLRLCLNAKIRRTLRITSVAFSPDSSALACGCWNDGSEEKGKWNRSGLAYVFQHVTNGHSLRTSPTDVSYLALSNEEVPIWLCVGHSDSTESLSPVVLAEAPSPSIAKRISATAQAGVGGVWIPSPTLVAWSASSRHLVVANGVESSITVHVVGRSGEFSHTCSNHVRLVTVLAHRHRSSGLGVVPSGVVSWAPSGQLTLFPWTLVHGFADVSLILTSPNLNCENQVQERVKVMHLTWRDSLCILDVGTTDSKSSGQVLLEYTATQSCSQQDVSTGSSTRFLVAMPSSMSVDSISLAALMNCYEEWNSSVFPSCIAGARCSNFDDLPIEQPSSFVTGWLWQRQKNIEPAKWREVWHGSTTTKALSCAVSKEWNSSSFMDRYRRTVPSLASSWAFNAGEFITMKRLVQTRCDSVTTMFSIVSPSRRTLHVGAKFMSSTTAETSQDHDRSVWWTLVTREAVVRCSIALSDNENACAGMLFIIFSDGTLSCVLQPYKAMCTHGASQIERRLTISKNKIPGLKFVHNDVQMRVCTALSTRYCRHPKDGGEPTTALSQMLHTVLLVQGNGVNMPCSTIAFWFYEVTSDFLVDDQSVHHPGNLSGPHTIQRVPGSRKLDFVGAFTLHKPASHNSAAHAPPAEKSTVLDDMAFAFITCPDNAQDSCYEVVMYSVRRDLWTKGLPVASPSSSKAQNDQDDLKSFRSELRASIMKLLCELVE